MKTFSLAIAMFALLLMGASLSFGTGIQRLLGAIPGCSVSAIFGVSELFALAVFRTFATQ